MAHPLYPDVFRPIMIGTTEVRNRIFVPAHTTNFGEDNRPSQRHLDYHRARAAGGAGLIIFEGIRVHRSSLGRRQGVNGYEPDAMPHFRRVAEAIQSEGGKLFGQIIHLGRHIDGNYARMPSWSASAIPWSATAPVPHPMSVDEINLVVEAHAQVAENLLAAGLDGIELQMAHGHLLQQFLSPASNVRDDDYGGTLDNRLRFARDTVCAVRQRIGPDATLGIRISADEYLLGGLTLENMCTVVRRLAEAVPIDFVNVSHSAYHGSYTVSTQMADMAFRLQDFQPLTRGISAALDGLASRPKVMTVCRYQTVAQAQEMLASGAADLVGMARAHIADPEIVQKAHDGREGETTPCIGCNQGCANMLALGLGITCLTNPRAGREAQWPAPAVQRGTPKRVLVIGAGPAGMEAAAASGERGFDVTLWERQDRTGGALNWLAKMPLRQEFGKLFDHQRARLRAASVQVELERDATARDVLAQDAHAIVWATGAAPQAKVFDSGRQTCSLEDALQDPDKLGNRIILVDTSGTWSVVSVAEYLADIGKSITLVVPSGMPGWTISMYSSFALRERLRQKNIAILAGHSVIDHHESEALIRDLSLPDAVSRRAADTVIYPVPGRARTRELNLSLAADKMSRTQRAVGDCLSPRTALEAVFEGYECAQEV